MKTEEAKVEILDIRKELAKLSERVSKEAASQGPDSEIGEQLVEVENVLFQAVQLLLGVTIQLK